MAPLAKMANDRGNTGQLGLVPVPRYNIPTHLVLNFQCLRVASCRMTNEVIPCHDHRTQTVADCHREHCEDTSLAPATPATLLYAAAVIDANPLARQNSIIAFGLRNSDDKWQSLAEFHLYVLENLAINCRGG